MMKPYISIIMPVYNAVNQVDSAISSIVAQTMPNWELLIIDDCSTDNTCEVVEKWMRKDERIDLIRLESNAGPGHAKNLGLSKVKGKYITFCDSDDWIERNAFAVLSNDEKEDSDVIIAGFYRDIYDGNNNIIESNKVQINKWYCNQKEDAIRSIVVLDRNRLFSYAVNKLYKTELVKKYNIKFSNKKFGEDFDFNLDFFSHCISVNVLNECFYHYIKQNENSLTERFIPDFYNINHERFERMRELMIVNECFEGKIRSDIMNLYIKHVIAAVARLYDKRGHISRRERVNRVKYMFSDKMSVEAIKYAKASSKSEKICNAVFKLNYLPVTLLFGRFLWIVQTKGRKIYEKVK